MRAQLELVKVGRKEKTLAVAETLFLVTKRAKAVRGVAEDE
jgi:hypothetical protein